MFPGCLWSSLCCVLSVRQRCGTGCSCGVSSPRSLSTGPWGCSCWSCCSATRGDASSPWCWSAWVSWPPSQGASSPVSPLTLLLFCSSVSAFFRLTSVEFSSQSTKRKMAGEVTGRERDGGSLLTPVKQRKTGVDRKTERERLQTLVYLPFCSWSTESFKYIWVMLRKSNITEFFPLFTPLM